MLGQRPLVDRLGRGKQQRLENTQLLAPFGRRQCGDARRQTARAAAGIVAPERSDRSRLATVTASVGSPSADS